MESIDRYMAADDMHGALEATELCLGLPGRSTSPTTKRLFCEEPTAAARCRDSQEEGTSTSRPAKSQIVGWPPVQAFRRNQRCHQINQANKTSPTTEHKSTSTPTTTLSPGGSTFPFVKVSMDGVPYLRKIDLGAYKGYKDLRLALDAMFRSCLSSPGVAHDQLTYQDNDGDWMLVGDVPWEMFAASCKKLRIIKSCSGEDRA